MHVLLIEDSRTQAAQLTALLEQGGHSVTAFGALEPAIEWCRASQQRGDDAAPAPAGHEAAGRDEIDAVLLDLNLPDADGLETLERMRAACAELPIVIMTALGDAETALRALRRGAQDYLVKGETDLSLLDRVLHYAVERQRAARELERLGAELRVKNEELEQANALKNQFLGVVSHDLRSPLGVIVVYLQLLRRGDANLSENQREMVRSIQRSTEFMWQLVNDLLDVSAIEAGRLDLRCTPTDACALLEAAVARQRLVCEAKQLSLALECEPELPRVRLDPPRIDQVLNNLLENAAKFSPPGSCIEVTLRATPDGVRIAVFNPGDGIAPERLAQLFQPFERGRREGTAGEKTTGLGLAIAKKIIDGHGGEIGCESTPGQGATFWFSLPRDAA